MDAGRVALRPCLVCGKKSPGTCRRRRCLAGVERWGTDVWTVLATALQSVDRVLLVVVTAPGADALPWDLTKCRHRRSEPCSGVKGCRVDERARDRWEAAATHRWQNLRQAVVMRLQRAGHGSPLLGYVDEDQRRGVWHRNLVLEDGPAAWMFVRWLSELAPSYGFGYVDRKPEVRSGVRAASYCAGYLTGKGGSKSDASVQQIAGRSPSRRRVWFVSPRLTSCSRVTMTTLRLGRRCMAARAGLIDPPSEGVAVLDWNVIDVGTGAVLRAVWAREALRDLDSLPV